MALELNETATLTLRMDGRDLNNELTTLNDKAKDLRTTINQIEKEGGKGSEEWKKYKNELAEVNAETAKIKKEVDIANLSYGQLQNLVKELAKDLKGLKPGTDEFVTATKRLSEAEKQLSDVNKQVDQIKKGGEEIGKPGLWGQVVSGVNSVSKAFGAFMALQVISYLVDGFKWVVGAFSSFEDAAQSLSAVTGLTGKDLEYMKDQAKATGPQFGMTATEMLEAYEKMGSAKPELLAQKELLAATTKEAIILAKAGKIDLTEATKATAESLNQFGQKADQARRFVNVMAAAVKEGSDEVSGISSALKASGSVANAASLSFEQTNAVLASLSSQAIKGEQAGTALRNVLIKMMSGADETNPKIVGLDKALENLGKQNLNTAQLAKLFGTENVVAAQHIVTHREEITELTKKMTGTNSAYEQAAINMNTLSEKWKQGTSIVTGFAVEIGEKLAPYVKKAIDFFIEWSDNLDVNSGVMDNLLGVLGDLWSVFAGMIDIIFPGVSDGGLTMRGVMQGVAVVVQTVVSVVRIFTSSLVILLEAFQAVGSGAKGLVLFLQGDFAGAGKAFEETRAHGTKIKDTFTSAFNDIGEGYKKAFADKPKETLPAAKASHQEATKTIQDVISDETKKGSDKRDKDAEATRKKAEADTKKHLEEVAKANEKALDDLTKMERERQVNAIKDELERDLLKLRQKRNDELRANEESLADAGLKQQKQQAIFEKYEAEETKLRDDHREKEKKKQEEAAQKRLEILKNVAKLEQDAEMALLDWKELQAKGNAQKLAEIARERADVTLRITKDRLKAEEEAEKAKIDWSVLSEEEAIRVLGAIEDKYHAERITAEKKAADEKAKIEKELQEKKKEFWGNASNAFSSLLKGDLSAFVDYSAKLIQGEQQNWQKRLQGNMELYQAIGQAAQQAAQFLASLAEKRAQKAIDEAYRERDRKVAALQEELTTSEIEIQHYEQRRQELTQHYSDQVKAIKEAEKLKISELEQYYSEISNNQSKADLDAEITRTNTETDTKISEAERTFQGESEKANATKTHKITVAETIRDAEIKAINERADLAEADKVKMIASATEKAEKAIALANQEAAGQIAASREATDKKIADATEEKDKKVELLNALNTHDGQTVQQMATRANEEASHQAQLAQQTHEVEVAKAEATRDQKITAANQTRDAEIKAINERSDLSLADKEKMIAASTDKANKEIALATDQADKEIALSADTKNKKIADAEEEKAKKIDLLQEYAADNDDKTRQAIENAQKQATESIAEAQRTKEEEIAAAEEKKDAQIAAAQKTRDEEISAILKRSDVSMTERKRLIDAAKEKAELEIKLANEEADQKMKLSREEADQKIKDATEEKDKKIELLKELATADKDRAEELLKVAKDEADQKVKTAEEEKKKKLDLLEQENQTRIDQKIALEEAIAEANDEAREIEIAQKRKAWKAQKAADVTSAIISGALAAVKALASGFFPLNLVFAATTAALTAVQVAKIRNQPEPSFALGGVMKGGSHGVTYGAGGMAIIDRASGQERGEMEGDEAIISKEQTKANWGLISRMLDNARTPGRRHDPVAKDRPPVAFRDGGLLEPSRYGEMYLFGSKKRREALEAQAQAKVAEMEAQKAAEQAMADADSAAAEAGSYGDYSTEGGFEGGAANEAEAKAAHAEAVKQGKMQLDLLRDIVDAVDATNEGVQLALADLNTNLSNAMKDMSTNLGSSMDAMAQKLSGSVDVMAQKVEGLNGSIMEVKAATNGVEGATHQVKDAVYATNAQGKLDQVIAAISSLG